jgi:small-conductance mechanosensitive channel
MRRCSASSSARCEDGAEAAASAARAAQRGEAIAAVLRSAVSFLVYLIAIFMILGEIGVELAPLLAGAGVVGLAVGFGAQSLVRISSAASSS